MDAGIVYGCLTPHPPILVPAIAGSRVEQVGQTRRAVQQVAREVHQYDPDVLLVISPHAPIQPFAMTACNSAGYRGGLDEFGPRLGLSVKGDPALAMQIRESCQALGVPISISGRSRGSWSLDHGAAVPLFFIQEAGPLPPIVLLGFCGLSTEVHRRFGIALASACRECGQRAVLIASGDMSHRLFPGAPAGYSPSGKLFDDGIVSALEEGNREAILDVDIGLREQAGECGYRSLVVALGALPEARSEVLSYEGPFGVGYLVARFIVGPSASLEESSADYASKKQDREKIQALWLARESVERYVRDGHTIEAPDCPEGALAERAGVFVTIRHSGLLRGCIGTFEPREKNVATEIIRNSIASATRDPRFPPVTGDELAALTYSVDILSRAELITDEHQLDPRRYGVLLQSGARKGLLLPDLEGVDTAAMQVEIARRKAGLAPDDRAKMFRFTVRRIQEPRKEG